MRLPQRDLEVIAQAAHAAFMPGTAIFLFGSRLRDEARGGDIDLLVETPGSMSPAELVRRRTCFVSSIYQALGEQRIDVVISSRDQQDSRAVVAVAKREGLKVVQI